MLYTSGYLGIARGDAGNSVLGDSLHTSVNLGVSSITGFDGADYAYTTVGGGKENASKENYTTVSGGNRNSSLGEGSTVGGGQDNTAIGSFSLGLNIIDCSTVISFAPSEPPGWNLT